MTREIGTIDELYSAALTPWANGIGFGLADYFGIVRGRLPLSRRYFAKTKE